jgi:hypothetical protein
LADEFVEIEYTLIQQTDASATNIISKLLNGASTCADAKAVVVE